MLPRVKINFENGALGGMAAIDDGVIGLLIWGVEVSGRFLRTKAYRITSLDGLTALGITSALNDVNAGIYAQVSDIYAEAPVGTVVWIKTTLDFAEWVADAQLLLTSAGGEIKLLVFGDSWSTDISTTMLRQSIGVWAADVLKAPVLVIGGSNTVDVPTYSPNSYNSNRVCLVKGGSANNPYTGLLAGRIAAIPVHRSVARVKDGPLKKADTAFAAFENNSSAVEALDGKGFISFRRYVGKGGYYFTDDKTCTDAMDDYSSIARRRTIDKAYRIAYGVLVNELNTEIAVTDTGAISAPIAKSIQNAVETAIENGMAASLGADPGNAKDTGVQCYINVNQNIVSTGVLNVALRIKPFGYAKYIDLSLGFKTTTA